MSFRIPSRADDEMALAVIDRWCRGESSAAIGRSVGRGVSYAGVLVSRVIEADLIESREPEAVVRQAYQRGRA